MTTLGDQWDDLHKGKPQQVRVLVDGVWRYIRVEMIYPQFFSLSYHGHGIKAKANCMTDIQGHAHILVERYLNLQEQLNY